MRVMIRKSQMDRSFTAKVPIGNISPTPERTDKDLSMPVEKIPSKKNQATRDWFNPPKGPRRTYSKTTTQPEKDSIDANQTFLNVGPAPQPLRFPGFATQQAPQNRNAPLVSGRLQNTKLGEFAVSDRLLSIVAELSKVMVRAGHLAAP